MGAPSAHRLAALQAVVLDCDGVLTPGDLYYDESGRRLLRFHSRDGFGLALLCRALPVAVLSGRPTDIAEHRLRELGIDHFVGACRDKAAGVQALCQTLEIQPASCAFVGDDLPDLAAFTAVGLRIAVADAAPELQSAADWITKAPGGQGAVREVAEAILKARGDWQRFLASVTQNPTSPAP